jgi:hypothetical protein
VREYDAVRKCKWGGFFFEKKKKKKKKKDGKRIKVYIYVYI